MAFVPVNPHPGPGSYDPLAREVTEALRRLLDEEARPDDVESSTLDAKEDRSTRAPDGQRLEGDVFHEATAKDLAQAAACLANAAGGHLLVGLDDALRGRRCFVGSRLDPDLLQRRIWELTQPSLTVEVSALPTDVADVRLVLVRVPRAVQAVAVGGRHTHRVGTTCPPMTEVDFRRRSGHDHTDETVLLTLDDVPASSFVALRTLLEASGEPSRSALARRTDRDLLGALGVLREGHLSRAGQLLLIDHDGPGLRYFSRPRAGASSRRRLDLGGRALLPAFLQVEDALAVDLSTEDLVEGFVRGRQTLVPTAVAREALVNALTHRDWEIGGDVDVDLAGAVLVVLNPGGLLPGLSPDRLLTAPSRRRNPHLADVMSSLRLAEREGIGVDLMYREMVAAGHQPPVISDDGGDVRCALLGGVPVRPVVRLTQRLSPLAREDVDLALLVHHLLDHPWADAPRLAPLLQKQVTEVRHVLEQALPQTLADGSPLLRPLALHGPEPAVGLHPGAVETVRSRLPYVDLTPARARPYARDVARSRGRVRARDLVEMLGLSSAQASRTLTDLRADGELQVGSDTDRGRSVFYVAAEPTAA